MEQGPMLSVGFIFVAVVCVGVLIVAIVAGIAVATRKSTNAPSELAYLREEVSRLNREVERLTTDVERLKNQLTVSGSTGIREER